MFLKPSTAVIGPGEADPLPAGVGRVDHEAEAGIVIGRRAHRVAAADALDYMLGSVRERRDRARSAEEGRPVHAVQGLRHVRADRSVHRDRARPGDLRSKAGSTASGGRRRAPGNSSSRSRSSSSSSPFVMTLLPGRHHLDRHAGRHRAAAAGRRGHGACRRRGRADEPGRRAGDVSQADRSPAARVRSRAMRHARVLEGERHHEVIHRYRQHQGHRNARRDRHHRRRDDQPVAAWRRKPATPRES